MTQPGIERQRTGAPIRIEDVKPPEMPHHLIVKEAFESIAKELDENGNTPRLTELRTKYFEILALYWQRVLRAYMDEHANLGLSDDDLNGEEIKIGDDVVGLIAIDAGYAGDNAMRLELKRRNAQERDELSFVVHHTGEIDELFMPSLSVTLEQRSDSLGTTEYLFDFLNGRIVSMLRDKYHEDPQGIGRSVYERRKIEFSRFEPVPSVSPQIGV